MHQRRSCGQRKRGEVVAKAVGSVKVRFQKMVSCKVPPKLQGGFRILRASLQASCHAPHSTHVSSLQPLCVLDIERSKGRSSDMESHTETIVLPPCNSSPPFKFPFGSFIGAGAIGEIGQQYEKRRSHGLVIYRSAPKDIYGTRMFKLWSFQE